MEYHEMNEDTWIHYNDDHYFVYEDHGNYFEILTSAWSPETRQSNIKKVNQYYIKVLT